MARRPGSAGDLSLALALAGLLAGASLSLARLYETGEWLLPTWLTIAAALGLAALLRRLGAGTLLALLGMVAGFLVVAGNLLFPDTMALVLPTPDTLEAMGAAARTATTAAVEQSAPVGVSREFLLLTCAGTWAVATSADGLAFRAGQPLLAIVPALGLFIFPAMIRPVGPGWYTLWFLLGAGALLLREGRGRLAGWGRWVDSPRVVPGRGWRLPVSPANSTARRLAAGAGALALAVPWLLPGYGREPLLDYRGDNGPAATLSINPFVSLKPNLVARGNIRLFTVTSDRASYWRLVTLDRFDGVTWQPSVSRPTAPFTGNTEGDLAPGAPTRALDQRIRIARLGGVWLPAASAPAQIATDRRLVTNPSNRGFSIVGRWNSGFRYSVRSAEPAPTADLLRRPQDYSADELQRYKELPEDLDPRITELTDGVVGDAATPYDQALAIQDWLRSPANFRYSLDVPELSQGRGTTLVRFLTQVRAGYCEQFAAAMAAMARTLGIPSRVAVGFTPGSVGDNGWDVTANDAHAWPELYFNDVGWIRFEPTPRSDQISDPAWTTIGGRTSTAATTTTTPGGGATPTPTPGLNRNRAPLEEERPTGGTGGAGGGPGWLVTRLLPAVLVVVLLVAAIPLGKLARRAGDRRRAGRTGASGRTAVRWAWLGLAGWLADAGLARAAAETPGRFAERVAAAHPAAAGPMQELTRAFVAAEYGGPGAGDGLVAAPRAWELERAARTAVASGISRRSRLRAAFSLRGPLARLRAALRAGGSRPARTTS
jgi:transglutaminase-like putative cysteine protease